MKICDQWSVLILEYYLFIIFQINKIKYKHSKCQLYKEEIQLHEGKMINAVRVSNNFPHIYILVLTLNFFLSN